MKKLILTLFTVIAFINVQAQCNSNPISDNGASGTVNFSDSSTVSSSFSTNYSVSYLWDFGDGTTSTQQSPCHTYGDLSNVTFPLYATLSVTYLDSTIFNFCQDIDSVPVYILMNPCNYGDLQIAASGNNLTANWTYSVGGSPGCSNNYADTYLWSNGDTNQTTAATNWGVYSCTVTTSTGCVYTTSYTYNGSLNLTFDCSQMDIFEANNDLYSPSFQSAYLNNNNLFPELIDSLSFWDVYDASGQNIGLYPMIWQGAPATFSVQNGLNGLPPSDSLYVCYEAYLYDSLYQHNLWVNPPQGSVCSSCEWLVWDATSNSWVIGGTPPTPTFICDPIFGCFDPGTGTGLYNSLAQCQAACSSSWSNVFCDSLDVSVIASTVDSITLGTNLSSLGYTGPASYTWTEFTLSGINGTGNTSTSATPSFEIAIGDTNIYLLELTIINNNGMSSMCLYPTLVYFDGGSWIALRTSQPGTTLDPLGIYNLDQAISNRKLLKIVDIMGRETEFKKNEVLFYMYDDGSTEKKFFKYE